jgi:hypothetical protein
MVGPWPAKTYTVRALAKTSGTMWLRCDVCCRYATLKLAGHHNVDYRARVAGRRPISASSTRPTRPAWKTIGSMRWDSRGTILTPSAVSPGADKRAQIDFSRRGKQPGRKTLPHYLK